MMGCILVGIVVLLGLALAACVAWRMLPALSRREHARPGSTPLFLQMRDGQSKTLIEEMFAPKPSNNREEQ